MVTAPDYALSALSHAGSPPSAVDARLFSLIEELRRCEKRRDELLAPTPCEALKAIHEVVEEAKLQFNGV